VRGLGGLCEGACERPDGRWREQPPGVDAHGGERGRGGERDGDGERDAWVITEREVVEERQEGAHVAHAGTLPVAEASVPVWRRRKTRTSARELSSVSAMSAGIAASSPGQLAPAPSAAQK